VKNGAKKTCNDNENIIDALFKDVVERKPFRGPASESDNGF
jgi:hypothetical protein